MQFGDLRVINEDRVIGGEGFGRHPHSNFEIFSYVLEGQLEHQDSLGNREVISPNKHCHPETPQVLKRGDVQFTSTGSGISHSEYNHSKKDEVYFLQIWVKPDQKGLTPGYQTKTYSEQSKRGNLVKIIQPKVISHNYLLIEIIFIQYN